MAAPNLDEGAAIAVISFSVLEVFRMYQSTAPKLADVRAAKKDDWKVSQQLLDADVMTGGLVVIMGLAGLFLMNRKYPLVFLFITWIAVSYYYHSVRVSPASLEEIGA